MPPITAARKSRTILAMLLSAVLLVLTAAITRATAFGGTTLAQARAHMVATIRAEIRATRSETGVGALPVPLAAALSEVPRDEFVPSNLRAEAYLNRPLPIGYGQTISQPYIVALMTALLNVPPEGRVLEVGTGSGYQAAVLAQLTAEVYSVEIIAPLAERARARLARLGYHNVQVKFGDGYYGWREHAPYDAIIVTAATGHVPPPLVAQLKAGGRMVIPVGGPFMVQQLVLVEKASDGHISTRQILPVRFVPLTGRH